MSVFAWPVRIYWEDTDAGGVVYHANYVRFMERARTEWLRAQGIDQMALREATSLGFVVRDMHLDFHRPARLDDELLITVDVKERRSASMLFGQEIVRGDAALVRAQVRVACVNLDTMRPAQIPADLFPSEFP
ncbi:tol-pal system-associated acyl-CoA thioesterase [Luteibacter sp. UNCMF366Tsu5.1]|uniref:Tol-pal system-associated acyl-CoA thioesterase n=1 Tax=Luteibacter flocculans TaxID=2780091 RepID=A0ABY4T5A2_9GAMM|nr:MULTISPECIES: tol-pal system-associated acyl-CoA thioesterase [Luteibacter]URL59098.1 tol-pal system-associated acyl-CoA thioesterase [Luteibacter flocculans]SFW56892.1 acyl-CoA thioester hydrolase [Luteibacter sp. UNCMF366Tsu5.1]